MQAWRASGGPKERQKDHMADLRSISTRRWRASLEKSARIAAKAVPSWHTAHSVPSCRTHLLNVSFRRPACMSQ